MKIDFSKINVQVSFDGTFKTFNIAKEVGNDMMFNGSVIADIGFEELAKRIYFSDGEVEIPAEYVKPLLQVIMQGAYIATIKKYIIKVLNGE
ncbi:MAG: hypothetical protein IKO37_01775 [Prevotella sp.]|jgi:hypothetical protein|nr:hypothetical protein [Prevotella sp.]